MNTKKLFASILFFTLVLIWQATAMGSRRTNGDADHQPESGLECRLPGVGAVVQLPGGCIQGHSNQFQRLGLDRKG